MTNPIRQSAIKGLSKGDSFRYGRTFSKAETVSFGDMTRDYNPVHYDSRWAGAKGFRGVICHGLLVGSMVCEFGGQVGWLATGIDFRFIKPVYPGDTITCTIVITMLEESGRAEADAFFTNQNDEKVGYALLRGRVPVDQERDLLQLIMEEGDTTNKLSNETYRP